MKIIKAFLLDAEFKIESSNIAQPTIYFMRANKMQSVLVTVVLKQ